MAFQAVIFDFFDRWLGQSRTSRVDSPTDSAAAMPRRARCALGAGLVSVHRARQKQKIANTVPFASAWSTISSEGVTELLLTLRISDWPVV